MINDYYIHGIFNDPFQNIFVIMNIEYVPQIYSILIIEIHLSSYHKITISFEFFEMRIKKLP